MGVCRLLKQIVWIELRERDNPKVFFRKTREHLMERHLVTRSLNPTQALSLYASLHPGLEKFSADASQAWGSGGRKRKSVKSWRRCPTGRVINRPISSWRAQAARP